MLGGKSKLLGRGGFGSVYEGKDEHNQQIAVKVIDLEATGIPNVLEMSIMSSVVHPNINGCTQIRKDDSRMYLLQRKGVCDLRKFLAKNTLTIQRIKLWSYKLIHAIAVLHQQRVVHADIKPQNIIVYNDDQIKLTDFGVSVKKWEKDTLFYHTVGTPSYRAPECVQGQGWNEQFDMWSLGCVLYEMRYGKQLFPSQTFTDEKYTASEQRSRKTKRLHNVICDWQYFYSRKRTIETYDIVYRKLSVSRKFNKSYNQEFNQFLLLLLDVNPENRPTAKQLLTHEFFTGFTTKINYSVLLNNCRNITAEEYTRITQICKVYKATDRQILHTARLVCCSKAMDCDFDVKVLVCYYITLKLFNVDVSELEYTLLPASELIYWELQLTHYLNYRLHHLSKN